MRKKFDLATAILTVETPEVEQLTFGELLHGWCAHHKDANDTLRLRKWVATFGEKSAWDITSAELATAAHAMKESGQYKASSINRDVASIGSAYKWAIERRAAPIGFASPTLAVKRYNESESIRRIFIDPEKLQKLRSLSLIYRDRRFGMFVHLLIDTGARKGELYERTWADLDLDKREILLHDSKTGKPRILHFGPETARFIARICPVRKPELLMFPGRVPSEPIDYRASWTKLTREAGLDGLHMHDVRHDKARRLLVEGTPLALAASVMGHGVQMLERRYGHLDVTDIKRVVEKTWGAAALKAAA